MFYIYLVTILFVQIVVVSCQVNQNELEAELTIDDVVWDKVDHDASETDTNSPLDNYWPFIGTSPSPQEELDEPSKCPRCTCGVPHFAKRATGRNESQVNVWPWIGLLLDNKNDVVCGSELISDRYALTAAHCVSRKLLSNLTMLFLVHNQTSADEPHKIYAKIRNVLIHPGYAGSRDSNKADPNNDLAIIRLTRIIKFNENITPVCLPLPRLSYKGVNATISGWGRNTIWEPEPEALQNITVPVLSNAECKMTSNSTHFSITENILCAGHPKGGKDTCWGDGGGSLVYRPKRRRSYHLIGISSVGYDCGHAHFPGLYVRANRYLSWIRSNTEDACYCDDNI